MVDNSTEMKKNLKELVKVAYEEELKKYLMPLHDSFLKWKENEVSSLNLANLVHRFHNGISKKLFRIYNNLESPLLVARAIALTLIPEDKIGKDMLDQLQEKIEFYKQQIDDIQDDDLDYEY